MGPKQGFGTVWRDGLWHKLINRAKLENAIICYKIVECFSPEIDNDVPVYLKLLYADDTVILSEPSHRLQKTFNPYIEYCKERKLSININK